MIGSCTCTDGEYRLSFFAYKTQFSGNFMCICQSKWSDHRRASDVSNCFGWWFSYSSNSIKIITKSGNEKNKNVQKWKIRNSNKKNKLKFYFDRSHFFIRKQQIVKYVRSIENWANSKCNDEIPIAANSSGAGNPEMHANRSCQWFVEGIATAVRLTAIKQQIRHKKGKHTKILSEISLSKCCANGDISNVEKWT